jgi:hypothetical protein
MSNKELLEKNQKRKICQICFVTRDMKKTLENWVKYLGIGPWRVITMSSENVVNPMLDGKPVITAFKNYCALAMVGDIQVEILQPVYGSPDLEKYLEERGEGFHHIKELLLDEDAPRVIGEFENKDVRLMSSGGFLGDRWYYVETLPKLNFQLELGNFADIDLDSAEATEWYIYPEESVK